jgi:hypothetical protein
MKKDFSGSSREEAYRKAREWWDRQTGLREIRRTEISIGEADAPNLRDAERWVVAIHYEPENAA